MALLKSIDAAALKNAAKRGHSEIRWDHVETQQREQLADLVDRGQEMKVLFDAAEDPALKVKISNELRQIDKAIGNLVAAIKVDAEPAPSVTSIKARKAANARWDRELGRNAG